MINWINNDPPQKKKKRPPLALKLSIERACLCWCTWDLCVFWVHCPHALGKKRWEWEPIALCPHVAAPWFSVSPLLFYLDFRSYWANTHTHTWHRPHKTTTTHTTPQHNDKHTTRTVNDNQTSCFTIWSMWDSCSFGTVCSYWASSSSDTATPNTVSSPDSVFRTNPSVMWFQCNVFVLKVGIKHAFSFGPVQGFCLNLYKKWKSRKLLPTRVVAWRTWGIGGQPNPKSADFARVRRCTRFFQWERSVKLRTRHGQRKQSLKEACSQRQKSHPKKLPELFQESLCSLAFLRTPIHHLRNSHLSIGFVKNSAPPSWCVSPLPVFIFPRCFKNFWRHRWTRTSNPFPEDVDLCCRLPLPTNHGNGYLMRLRDAKISR